MSKTPENLIEALMELNALLPIDDKLFMLLHDEDKVSALFHHSLGRHLRNIWTLWDENGSLHKWFLSINIHHADDMSRIIIVSYYRKLNCIPICLRDQVRHYKEYWIKNG